MPYIPPHLRPGYQPKVVAPVEVRRGIRFPTNALNATNMTTNVTMPNRSYSPVRNTRSVKPILKKNTRRVSPNKEPVAKPTHNVMKLPPKFRDMLLSRKAVTKKRTRKTSRGKRSGKRSGKRRGKRHGKH